MYVDINKPTFFLFTDASVNPQMSIGYGSSLLLSEYELEVPYLEDRIKTKRFEDATSSKLELQTLVWALESIKFKKRKILIYTDSQNIISLLERQNKLIENNFMNKKNEPLKNHKLYKKFYKLITYNECDIIKVKGHKKKEDKDYVDKLFTLVDRASRDALREEIRNKV
ncbi:MAG TPA: RNase H family protein [Sulfurimonas sp.]|jgi:ribonuclease HI|uniref:ribonuclease HI n=1 Tax=Sulfurimonas sp. TaxID=2022749 RepID=UPI002BA2A955|nr:RNase H family protein [Sulfurimonas sp.]HUH42300.1 RNase H family protein [Sulfurimonas sp.]